MRRIRNHPFIGASGGAQPLRELGDDHYLYLLQTIYYGIFTDALSVFIT